MICDKIPYPTYKAAQDHLNGLRKKHKGKKQLFRPYKCDKCPAYHVTTIHTNKLERPKKQDKYPFRYDPQMPVIEAIKKQKEDRKKKKCGVTHHRSK